MTERSEHEGSAKAGLVEPLRDPIITLPAGQDGADDPLMWFPAEDEHRLARTPARDRHLGLPWLRLALAFVAVAVTAGVVAWALWGSAQGRPSPTGTFAVESQPVGAEVWVDGRLRGVTPLKLTLEAGAHVFEVTAGAARREIKRRIEPGAQVFEYVDLPPVSPNTGRLSVVSRPPGARVSVDGRFRGVAPLEIDGLAAGEHAVSVTNGVSAAEESIVVQPGLTASLVVPLATAGSVSAGWISVASAVALQVFEGGALLGSTESARIMVPSGRHSFELRNDSLGFRVTQQVDVAPGRAAPIAVTLPNGTLHVNAIPWAEVLLDGRSLGETPLANLQVPIGSHELVFRNAQFTEQRRTVTVSLTAPTRLGVDMRK